MITLEKKINRNKKISLCFCLVFVLLSSFYCKATEWYASPTALVSGNGSIGSPFQLQTALSSTNIQAGDTLWLRGGTYKGRFICTLSSGFLTKITVASYSGEWAVLDGNILPLTSNNKQVLSVLGDNVRFKNFEITYSNVVRTSNSANFAQCGGISHTDGEDCEFINLIIHELSDIGVASWKDSGGTFFYGCIVFNNGYLNPVVTERGHGPGFYTQNKSDKYRVFKNNIVFNNFHEGFECYSSTESTPFEYSKNFTFDDNVVFNNGSPYMADVNSPRATNLNVSNASFDGSNIIRNINIINNTLYHNTNYTHATSNGEMTSLKIGNPYIPCPSPLNVPGFGSENIVVRNNFISGRNNHIYILNVNTLTFEMNTVMGRFLAVDVRNRINNKITPANWKFNFNKYYSSNANCNSPGVHTVFRMIQDDYNSTCTSVILTTVTDYHVYNFPVTTPAACYRNWANIFNIDTNSSYGYYNLADNASRPSNAYGPFLNPPKVLSFTQNVYKPNQYRLALFYDPGNSNIFSIPTLPPIPSNPMVTVNFFDYGLTIPNGTPYTIRDVEDLYSPVIISNVIQNNQIQFNLNTPGFDTPNGVDFINSATKTPDNFGVFLLEFANYTGCETNRIVASLLPSGTLDFVQAQTTISTTSIINTGSVGIYHAGSSVTLSNGFHSKSGSKFRGYIEGCTQSFEGRMSNTNINADAKETTSKNISEPEEFIKIYPNPSSGIFNIESINNKNIKSVMVSRIDNGKIVLEEDYNLKNAGVIDIKKENTGMYAVKVVFEDNSTETKTIIKK